MQDKLIIIELPNSLTKFRNTSIKTYFNNNMFINAYQPVLNGPIFEI